MGGIGSGQWGGRPTTSSGLTLDLTRMMREGWVRPNSSKGGSLSWGSPTMGERVASIRYFASVEDSHGRLRLSYSHRDPMTGEWQETEYWVDLITTPQPFGGRRWWFRCPASGRRVLKLHLPPGQHVFASRKAHRLGYQSQRESPRDRATSRAFKLRRQLGADGGIGDYVEKPKWMRWATFNRKMERICAAEDICEGHMIGTIARLMERFG